jgi:hypothetical protein
MLLVTGAALSAFLGYRLLGWWAPAVVAATILVAQAVAYQGVLSGRSGLSEFAQVLVLSGLMSFVLFYATFSIGRSLGQWRKGVR